MRADRKNDVDLCNLRDRDQILVRVVRTFPSPALEYAHPVDPG